MNEPKQSSPFLVGPVVWDLLVQEIWAMATAVWLLLMIKELAVSVTSEEVTWSMLTM